MTRRLLNTGPVREVARIFLTEGGSHYAAELCEKSKLGSGTVTPMLRRFFKAGWLVDEGYQPSSVGGSPRRCYRMTPEGREAFAELLGEKG